MTPWPGAFTELCGKRLKIFKAVLSSLSIPSSALPGTIVCCNDKGLFVAAGNGVVQVLELMGSSGKRLDAAAFLCGNKIDLPACFE